MSNPAAHTVNCVLFYNLLLFEMAKSDSKGHMIILTLSSAAAFLGWISVNKSKTYNKTYFQ